jgi:NAD(P)-dependent dehydrogenase (short-subunit alcohol dehydrogenase family)/acyl dehydratase
VTPASESELLRISAEEMRLFSAASHDLNPLHVSPEFARRTPFGEPVVFGVLGALAALGHLHERPRAEPASLSLEFRSPLLVGVSYTVEAEDGAGEVASVRVHDLGRVALDAKVAFRAARAATPMAGAAGETRAEPAAWDLAALEPGVAVRGAYAPSLPPLNRLLERWSLPERGFAGPVVAALLWASYLVGMELPGEQATFWRLTLELPRRSEPATLPLRFDAAVRRRDERIGLVELQASLASGGKAFAAASIGAFVRPDSPRADPEAIARLLAGSPRLDRKTALVVGGSRGLGAGLAQGLALQGAHVLVAYRDSAAEAERVRTTLPSSATGLVELIRGDAADPRWCRDVLRPLVAARGGLDVLVANASPPIRPLPLTAEGIERFESFVVDSLRLATAPLAALNEEVAVRSGTVVFVSSTALLTLPPEWPHYVTAKAALEGFAGWAAARYPAVRFLVVRPPKLLTDQMNTILGRVGATAVAPVAAAIVRRLAEPRTGNGVELFDPAAGPPRI